MKILFLTPQTPYPPRQGAALRNWGLISQLMSRHEITVLTFSSPSSRTTEAGTRSVDTSDQLRARWELLSVPLPVRSWRDRLRDMLTTRQPDMALRLVSETYAHRLTDLLSRRRFDIALIGGIEMAPYLDILMAARPLRPRILFDDLNCEFLLQKRAFLTDLRSPVHWAGAAYSWVQWHRLRRYEAAVCRRADQVIAVSGEDAAALRRLVPGLDVAVIPNGVDAPSYPFVLSPPESHTLVFTGTMDFRPNVDAMLWFTRHVFPRIQAEHPAVRLDIVGQRPHRRLERLRRDPAITLTGWVEDVRPYIASAAVYIAPLRIGGGTRLKLLEAMAMGKAIVSTSLGAEGYPVSHGRELWLADSPADFASAVLALLRLPQRREELGRAARTFVESRYDWRIIVPRLETILLSSH